MQKRMTITMDEEVYECLVRVVGRRKISGFLESLARAHVVTDELADELSDELADGYKAMGQDEMREQEALLWSEALIADSQGMPQS